MHHTTTERLRPGLIKGLAIGLLLTQPALSVFAQTNTTTNTTTTTDTSGEVVKMGEFKVTSGFAGSLAAAAAAKLVAPTVTEVLMSEDIGKLPDISIADSLTRLTGLTTQRVNGRSQDVIIRGFTGDFSTGLLNGLEQVSTGENRAVEFDQYPAEPAPSTCTPYNRCRRATG